AARAKLGVKEVVLEEQLVMGVEQAAPDAAVVDPVFAHPLIGKAGSGMDGMHQIRKAYALDVLLNEQALGAVASGQPRDIDPPLAQDLADVPQLFDLGAQVQAVLGRLFRLEHQIVPADVGIDIQLLQKKQHDAKVTPVGLYALGRIGEAHP